MQYGYHVYQENVKSEIGNQLHSEPLLFAVRSYIAVKPIMDGYVPMSILSLCPLYIS